MFIADAHALSYNWVGATICQWKCEVFKPIVNSTLNRESSLDTVMYSDTRSTGNTCGIPPYDAIDLQDSKLMKTLVYNFVRGIH